MAVCIRSCLVALDSFLFLSKVETETLILRRITATLRMVWIGAMLHLVEFCNGTNLLAIYCQLLPLDGL